MDVPDEGYRHIGKCRGLTSLVLMYCRDTGDAATSHITGLPDLRKYFASYNRVTDRTPEMLATIPSLEEITFDSCAGLTNAGIAALAHPLPRCARWACQAYGPSPPTSSGRLVRVSRSVTAGETRAGFSLDLESRSACSRRGYWPSSRTPTTNRWASAARWRSTRRKGSLVHRDAWRRRPLPWTAVTDPGHPGRAALAGIASRNCAAAAVLGIRDVALLDYHD